MKNELNLAIKNDKFSSIHMKQNGEDKKHITHTLMLINM
jgi:hypothetical protein